MYMLLALGLTKTKLVQQCFKPTTTEMRCYKFREIRATYRIMLNHKYRKDIMGTKYNFKQRISNTFLSVIQFPHTFI